MEEGKKYCKHCGELIDVDCVICPKCGKQVEQIAGYDGEIASPKKWLTALLLCIFLGALGVHRYYAGKIFTGILMIPCMFIGVGEIWLIIDLICIITGHFKDKQGRPIKR